MRRITLHSKCGHGYCIPHQLALGSSQMCTEAGAERTFEKVGTDRSWQNVWVEIVDKKEDDNAD